MKLNTDKIIEEISDFLVVYLKSGKVGVNSFIRKAHINVSQIEQLIDIHFLMKKEVIEYVRQLPILIRRFKTSTASLNETYYGEIRGSINWGSTIKKRLERGYIDKTVYSCNEQLRHYDIKENIVLKGFIQLLFNMLDSKSGFNKFMKYEWFAEWSELKVSIDQIYNRNIYLSRVSLERVGISDRMLLETAKHRNPLYRTAAILFIQYRQLHKNKLNEEEIKSLLRETFVFPEKKEVLFELYWAIQLIRQNNQNVTLELLDGRQNLFASWKDELFNYRLYHDSIGSGNLSFLIRVNEALETYHPLVERKINSMVKASCVAIEVFGNSFNEKNLWSGRPDLILEVSRRNDDKLVKVIIGEVKHTSNVNYAITGLRELIDYMNFIKEKNGHFINSTGNIEIKGILFLDQVHVKQPIMEDVMVVNHGYKDLIKLN
ncbi:hypothetical protein CN514_06150 [Bacillus sp. AFS001701]|uniref:hypothetical protein n=1 Tax=Bacillus sp. AFS001701 TaxID=2033480 RepID=UPI000BF2C49E|nr:hypothetical protein [Bacillus sp. AFS001701]PET71740.1 hypothetical protein CN514_06150 [Bacillus sp. AFS001701]